MERARRSVGQQGQSQGSNSFVFFERNRSGTRGNGGFIPGERRIKGLENTYSNYNYIQ